MTLKSVENFRGLGGIKTEGGSVVKPLLFRSGHLYTLSEEDSATIDALGVAHVVDYRSPAEVRERPVSYPHAWSPNHTKAAIGGNAAAWIKDLFERMAKAEFPRAELEETFMKAYRDIPLKNAKGIKLLFDGLLEADEGEATLFHCSAGKDRTGITAALLLRVLGVHDDDIYDNFLETNSAIDIESKSAHLAEFISKKSGRDVTPDDVWPLAGVRAAYLATSFEAISAAHLNLDRYLRDALGMTMEKRERLKAMYLG